MKKKQSLAMGIAVFGIGCALLAFQNCGKVYMDIPKAPGVGGLSSSSSGANVFEVVGDPTGSTPDPNDTELALPYGCTSADIKDLLLNIESVTLNNQTIAIGLGAKSILLDTLELPVSMAGTGSEIVLHLAAQDNWVVDPLDLDFSLKVPTGATVAIKLPQTMSFKAMTMYKLTLALDSAFQISKSATSCLFTPVLKATSVAAQP